MREPTGEATRLTADVLVVGSGAGGAPTAAILAEAGFDVVVLEEGPLVRQGDVTPFSLEQMDRQYRGRRRHRGHRPARRSPTPRAAARAAAPRSTAGSTADRRRRSSTAGARTAALVDFDSDELYRICDEVEQVLSVQTVPGDQTAASEALRRGAAALGWRHDEIPRWMDYPAGSDARSGRRRSMTETYLPQAEAAGARVLTGYRVDRLVLDGGRAFRAESTTTTDGRAGHGRLRPRRRLRRRHPDAGPAAALGAAPPHRPLARRAPDGQAGRPLRRAGQRRRRRGGPPGEGVRPRPLLRRVGLLARAGRALALGPAGTASARPSWTGSTCPSTTRRSRARAGAGCSRCPACATRS